MRIFTTIWDFLIFSTNDYVGISGSSHTCGGFDLHSRYCGNTFATDAGQKVVDATAPRNVICDCTAPFAVEIHTDASVKTSANAAVAADGSDLPSAGTQRGMFGWFLFSGSVGT